MLRQLRLSTQTRHNNLVGSSKVIQNLQLMQRKPPRHENDAQRNQQDDKNRKAHGRQRVGDGDAGGYAGELEAGVEANLSAAYGEEWLIALDEAFLALQEDGFMQDAVGRDGAPSDDKEDACKKGGRHRMQDCKEGTGHRTDKRESHKKVGDALLNDGRGSDDGATNLSLFALRGADDFNRRFVDC